MSIATQIKHFATTLPQGVQLIAVSKTRTAEEITIAYNAGPRLFGENRVQELVAKHEHLPKDINWHFIGHLQTNKVKDIAPFIQLIHSVDSLRLLKEINKEGMLQQREINCLLEFHIAKEESKFGLKVEEACSILGSPDFIEMKNVKVCGVMGMATFTDDVDQQRIEFNKLKTIFMQLKSQFFVSNAEFKEISMGMSDDYKVAIEEGSSLIRVGTAIFGDRG